jgi:diaminohydroxyphosphoribosylaminopyrimidine deaminase / 5-amino-6-(5-phosphoribosylamino)uracil reductase
MEISKEDTKFMERCMYLASMGSGKVHPNPMVGAVLVHEGKIIGEGYHAYFGGPHAEVNAIHSLKDPGILKASSLYVNLEPCTHFGKTPPCTDLILAMGIPRIVIGTPDPNPAVSGNGIALLRRAGRNVISNVLADKCRWLNRRFFTFYEKHRPYIILKWAQSSDGFIDRMRTPFTPIGPTWITNEAARQLVHKWRSEEMAIMAGTNTIEKDNPRLNLREWEGRNPMRIIPDRTLRLPETCHVFDGSVPTIVFTEKYRKSQKNLEFIQLPFNDTVLESILKILFERGIQSLFVEGGARLLQGFIDRKLWDEARVFEGRIHFSKGVSAPVLTDALLTTKRHLGTSKYNIYTREENDRLMA